MKILNIFLSVILFASLMQTVSARMMEFSPEMTIIDLEDITGLFKKNHGQTVHIIHNDDSPVKIIKAEVFDKGTARFPDLKGGVDDYQIEVQNLTDRTILAYEVTWTLRHPFEDYTFKKITANSIDKLGPGKTQGLEFRRDKYFRADAYYYAEITKVEFNDDESIWEAPEHEESFTEFAALKKEIDSMEEEDIEDMSTDELIEKTGATLLNGSTAE